MNILVGDLGGTHTRLAMAELKAEQVELSRVARFINSEHVDLNAILARFIESNAVAGPTLCCLAVAGPTDGQRVQFTNLAWRVETASLIQRFGFVRCHLINDFVAVGWGLNTLSAENLATLQTGQAIEGAARVALGAGTGLGVSLCAWHQNHYRPLASEGGHLGFAPANPEQDRLLVFLRGLHGRVSVERILSGPGLIELFRFCLAERGESDSPLLRAEQPAAAISQAGLAREDVSATNCLRMFAEIFGQTAGDWALACQAAGGIYLAGGIAPKLLPALQNGDFLAGFLAKGRYSDWMREIPVSVVLDPDIGLKGAAFAATQAEA